MNQEEIKAEMAYREAERIGIMLDSNPSLSQNETQASGRQDAEDWKSSYLATKPWERIN